MADIRPPKQYRGKPRNKFLTVERTLDEIAQICAAEKNRWPKGMGACTLIKPDGSAIVLWPEGKSQSGPLWDHEMGHVNGWPNSHPK